MKRRNFFTILGRMMEKDHRRGSFFRILERQIKREEREAKRAERNRIRRERNASKAARILTRIHKVQAIDLYKMTQHIPTNFFGERGPQFEAVKKLYNKKARILWFLQGLYKYWMFDYEGQGWSARRGFQYSRHRKHYTTMLELHTEKMKQRRWDEKRAKVRARRMKKDPEYYAKRELDRDIEYETQESQIRIRDEKIQVEELIWDE